MSFLLLWLPSLVPHSQNWTQYSRCHMMGQGHHLDPILRPHWLGPGQLLYQLQQTSSSEEFSLWSPNRCPLTEGQPYSLMAGIQICLKYRVISGQLSPSNQHTSSWGLYLCVHVSLVPSLVSDIVRAQKIAVNEWMNECWKITSVHLITSSPERPAMGHRHWSHSTAVGLPPPVLFYFHYTQLHRDHWPGDAAHFPKARDTGWGKKLRRNAHLDEARRQY